MKPKRSEVYFHDGNLLTLANALETTDKAFYTRRDHPAHIVYRLLPYGTGKPVCGVNELQKEEQNNEQRSV